MDQIRLDDLNIFSNEQLTELRNYNIVTAEHFVGLCATPEGFKGIMMALHIAEIELRALLDQVKSQLPPELAKLLTKSATVVPHLGARKPSKVNKKRINKKHT